MPRNNRRRPQADCHPEFKAQAFGLCPSCYGAQYRSKNRERLREKGRDADLRRSYGITLEERNILEHEQGNRCAICASEPANGKRLHVDHCHETGRVRGLLCAMCNWYLGKVDAKPSILDELIEYRRRNAPN